ncbi:MAG: MFS transporter [Candidatus Micrarchaeaceae archaeon]
MTPERGVATQETGKEKKPLQYDVAEKNEEMKYGVKYKWIVLSNTTIGALMAAIDGSIVLISLPAIFNGLGVNPLVAQNIGLLIWLLLGYMIVTSVLVVTLGRLGDMFGRVKIYNIGFLIFAVASTMIWISSYLVHGPSGALSIIGLRLVQAFGSSCIFASMFAMLTDAFPHKERGMALGINGIAFAGGSVIGLVVGGVLASIDWHLIFLISVPVGVAGAIWSYTALHEIATIKKGRKLDIAGNVTFAIALTAILLSLTYSFLPYGTATTGWSDPFVIGGLIFGLLILGLFVFVETRVEDPMFHINLFKNRTFSAANLSGFLAGTARGGLQFMLIIWLQGIWLPLHGVAFSKTPLLAAIYMLPLTVGFLIFGPLSGKLSDKYGQRPFTTTGMILNVAGFALLLTLPTDFALLPFVAITFIIGCGQGLFNSPNSTSIMNAVPPEQRGAVGGMRATIFNVSYMFSIIIFFSILVTGFGTLLPHAMYSGLTSQGVPSTVAASLQNIPPTSALFATFLGYNPLQQIIPQNVLSSLTQQQQKTILSTEFFPELISQSFINGLRIVLYVAIALTIIAAVISATVKVRSIYEPQEMQAHSPPVH